MSNKLKDMKIEFLDNDMNTMVIQMGLDILLTIWKEHLDELVLNCIPLMSEDPEEIKLSGEPMGTEQGEYLLKSFKISTDIKNTKGGPTPSKVVLCLMIDKYIRNALKSYCDILSQTEIEECDNELEKEFLTQTMNMRGIIE